MGAIGAGLLAIVGAALSALGVALQLETWGSVASGGPFGAASMAGTALASAALIVGLALLALGLLFVRRGERPSGR